MPNWAYNNNLFYSKNKDIIYDLHDKLNSWSNMTKEELNSNNWNGCSKWLGNILIQAQLDETKVIDGYYGKCRGEISEITAVSSCIIDGMEYYYFAVDTETAWCQMSKMWVSLFEHLYGDKANEIKYSWLSEEEGSTLYERHDPNKMLRLLGYSGNEKYLMESYISKNSKYANRIPYSSKMLIEEEVFKIVGTFLNKEISKNTLDDSVDEINELLYSENEDAYLHIRKFEDVKLLID